MNNPLFSTYYSPKPKSQFIIYSNKYLTQPQDNTRIKADIDAAIVFSGFMLFDYNTKVTVPYEPIEGSSFSSDSVQDSPDTIRIIGAYCPWGKGVFYTNDMLMDAQATVEAQLQTYKANTTLLTIIKSRPIFKTYTNFKLISYEFNFNPEQTALIADCMFQEIRTNRGASAYSNQVNDPQNSTMADNGIVTPTDALPNINDFVGVA